MGPRYIGSFRVVARFGKVVYRLEFPEKLGRIHNTFHVSHLRKCIVDQQTMVPLDDIHIYERQNYMERPVSILQRKMKIMRNKEITLLKVQWEHWRGYEWTWEPEAEMREHYPALFTPTDFKDEV